MQFGYAPCMTSPLRPSTREWGFVVVMVVVCSVLAVLQFRWTGEIAAAERARLGAGLEEQATRLSQAFDAELATGCARLLPKGAEISNGRLEEAFIRHLKAWKSSGAAPIFSRIAVAVPGTKEVALSELNQQPEALVPMAWPAAWEGLRGNLARKSAGGSPPYQDSTGLIIEFPIRGAGIGPGPRGGPPPDDDFGIGLDPEPGPPVELAWMIFEIDQDYLKNTWLPELVRTYLNPGEQVLRNARVENGDLTLFSNGGSSGKTHGEIRVPMNLQGRAAGVRADHPVSGAWSLVVAERPGELDRVVSASRARNLALAVVLNLLILVAGGLLVRQTQRSRLLAEERMRFVATVSHELRTPLTVIRGAAHNLKRGVVTEPEKVKQYSTLIAKHADDLGEMIGQVLDFSSAGKAGSISRKPVSMAEVLRDARLATEADTRDCVVEVDGLETLPPVSGDPSALRRVFQNLLSNAAKHGGSGGWIGVSAREVVGKREIEVRVADRGPGIHPSELAGLFTPFFRGERARATQTRGSGLGLSLAKEIVEAHGGRVAAEASPGGGACFIVWLPVDTRSS
ncbi:hypothetical protein llg_32560 [Luteolibacter sp. LG18]|nr:hypothetical protein llg_32560 [Luteolibacter sp. LG18]